MTRIGLISDTHGSFPDRLFEFFKTCDEIWHAGDIGSADVLEKLREFRPLRAVYGNIDGTDIRISCPLEQLFDCEDVRVYMIHIGGYPGNYNPHARKIIEAEKPGLFISGHSHILKVIYDKKFRLLHINPGAAGKSGLHKVITLVRFSIDGRDIRDLEISETHRHQ